MGEGLASIMVTGSHIPDDRNGIKFNRPTGEILKEDEAGIRRQEVAAARRALRRRRQPARCRPSCRRGRPHAYDAYVARYLDFFPAGCLAGCGSGSTSTPASPATSCVEVLAGLGRRGAAPGPLGAPSSRSTPRRSDRRT